jgi:hypothetical protein
MGDAGWLGDMEALRAFLTSLVPVHWRGGHKQ